MSSMVTLDSEITGRQFGDKSLSDVMSSNPAKECVSRVGTVSSTVGHCSEEVTTVSTAVTATTTVITATIASSATIATIATTVSCDDSPPPLEPEVGALPLASSDCWAVVSQQIPTADCNGLALASLAGTAPVNSTLPYTLSSLPPYSVPVPVPYCGTTGTTSQYLRSMQAYTGQSPATACLQPGLYNHYMYGTAHGAQRVQRTAPSLPASLTSPLIPDASCSSQTPSSAAAVAACGVNSFCHSANGYLNGYCPTDGSPPIDPSGYTSYGYAASAPSSSEASAMAVTSSAAGYLSSSHQSMGDYSNFYTGQPFYWSNTATSNNNNNNNSGCHSYGMASPVEASGVETAPPGDQISLTATHGNQLYHHHNHQHHHHHQHHQQQQAAVIPAGTAVISQQDEFVDASGSLPYQSTMVSSTRRRRNSNGTSSNSSRRKRRPDPSPEQDLSTKIDRIFIWDLDETIIVFHSLLTGQYARENDKNVSVCSRIGNTLENLVFTLGEELFFLKELDVESQYPTHVTNIDDLHAEDNNQDLSNYNFMTDGLSSTLGVASPIGYSMARSNMSADIARKIAFRHRRVKDLYTTYRNNVSDMFRDQMHGRHPTFERSWMEIRKQLEAETSSWLTKATSCLKLIQERKQCTNVLVTRNMLMTALAKAVIFGVSDCFEPQNIFSAYKVGFETCLNTIRMKYTERFGREVICVVVGKPETPDNPSIITAARQFGMPYFPINSDKDLHALQFFLQYGYM